MGSSIFFIRKERQPLICERWTGVSAQLESWPKRHLEVGEGVGARLECSSKVGESWKFWRAAAWTGAAHGGRRAIADNTEVRGYG